MIKIITDSTTDEIISMHISSTLSGTVNPANVAKEILKTDKITVIDSKSTTVNLAYKVEKAVELTGKGLSRTEIEKHIDEYYNSVFSFFFPMYINYLSKISFFTSTKIE